MAGNSIPEATPTRQALDEAVPDRPVYLAADDSTTAWVNSAALKLAKIGRRTANPDGGQIAKDKKGDPTGILEGTAANSSPGSGRNLRTTIACARCGMRWPKHSVSVLPVFRPPLRTRPSSRRSHSLAATGRWTCGCIQCSRYVVRAPTTRLVKLDPVLVKFSDDPLMKSGAAAVPLESVDADGLNRLVRLLDGRGWQVSIETDSPEEAEEAREPLSLTRCGRTARSFASGDIASSIRTAIYRDRQDESDRQRLAARSACTDAGVCRPRGDHALNDALRAYTFGGAFASYDEKRKGTLEAGMLADIVVLSANIFEMEPAQLDTVKVAYTIFDGRIVYPADRRSTTFP